MVSKKMNQRITQQKTENGTVSDSHIDFEKLLRAIEKRRAKYSTDEFYFFNREEIYEEREKRIAKHLIEQ